jgi:hypothetical protein
MSAEATKTANLTSNDELSPSESQLGQVLALIYHILPHIDNPEHGLRVQASLRHAAALVESAREAHAREVGVTVANPSRGSVEPEIVAVIAAAVATVIGGPHRLVAVQRLNLPAPHLNVWAFEGRSQIFLSHRIR